MSAALLGILAIVVVVASVALWFRRIHAVAIPENRSAFVAAFVLGALLGAVALYLGPPVWPVRVALWGTTAAGVFLAFTVGVSAQKVGADAIRVGAKLPAFTAIDEDGAPFDSQSLAGHPVLIKFFRGHW